MSFDGFFDRTYAKCTFQFSGKKCAQKQDQNGKFWPFCLKTCEIEIAFRTPQKDHTQARFKILFAHACDDIDICHHACAGFFAVHSLKIGYVSCMKSKESITSHFDFTIFSRRFCAIARHKKYESLKKDTG